MSPLAVSERLCPPNFISSMQKLFIINYIKVYKREVFMSISIRRKPRNSIFPCHLHGRGKHRGTIIMR
ncbi:MAG: hypothetical protein H6Q61_242 [Firmicutes bacterium]|nr:hypothetical protein [Bacillota bacterium]